MCISAEWYVQSLLQRLETVEEKSNSSDKCTEVNKQNIVTSTESTARTVSFFGIWTRTESSWSMSTKWLMAKRARRTNSQCRYAPIFSMQPQTFCACFQPFFKPKKSSSSSSSSCMVSRRVLIVSTSTRGSKMLERNLLAPPGVFVWLSTPKRVWSLLERKKKRHSQTAWQRNYIKRCCSYHRFPSHL